jgi:hypothetical protein
MTNLISEDQEGAQAWAQGSLALRSEPVALKKQPQTAGSDHRVFNRLREREHAFEQAISEQAHPHIQFDGPFRQAQAPAGTLTIRHCVPGAIIGSAGAQSARRSHSAPPGPRLRVNLSNKRVAGAQDSRRPDSPKCTRLSLPVHTPLADGGAGCDA